MQVANITNNCSLRTDNYIISINFDQSKITLWINDILINKIYSINISSDDLINLFYIKNLNDLCRIIIYSFHKKDNYGYQIMTKENEILLNLFFRIDNKLCHEHIIIKEYNKELELKIKYENLINQLNEKCKFLINNININNLKEIEQIKTNHTLEINKLNKINDKLKNELKLKNDKFDKIVDELTNINKKQIENINLKNKKNNESYVKSKKIIEDLNFNIHNLQNEIINLKNSTNKNSKDKEITTQINKLIINNDLVSLIQLNQIHNVITGDTFSKAVKYEKLEILKWLSDNDCEKPNNIFRLAIKNCDIEILQFLIEIGTEYGEHVFQLAVEFRDLSIIKWLRKDNYCRWNSYAFTKAVKRGDMNILRWLYDNDCPKSEWAFHTAVEIGDLELMEWLKNIYCPWSCETIDYAKKNPNKEKIIKWLIKNGCPN